MHWHDSSKPDEQTTYVPEHTLSPGGYISMRMMGYERRAQSMTLSEDKQLLTVSEKQQAAKAIIPNPNQRRKGLTFENAKEIYGGSDFSNKRQIRKSAKHAHDPFETGDCAAMQSWQMMSFPSCNFVHEVDLTDKREKLINGGHFRDVWEVNDWDGSSMVLKTLVYDKDFDFRNYDRHRRDALAMERLSKSKHIPNIYGYCANTGIFDLSEGDDLAYFLSSISKGERSITKIERLRIASQVATAVAEAHLYDSNGYPTIAHTDIAAKQFILVDGIYQLNDFNRCRFMRWDTRKREPCGFRIPNSPGKNRSPEEYSGKFRVLNEKVDVYSMGNIFYTLLMDKIAFDRVATKKARDAVLHGLRPIMDLQVKNSKNQVDIILLHAMDMCYTQAPEERASARDVANYLATELQKIEKQA